MNWILAVGAALAAFAVMAFAFRLPRATWTTLLAALALGLAGYATQASPGLPGAPKGSRAAGTQSEWPLIDARKELVAESRRSQNPKMITADALARRGQYANAAAMLRGAVSDNPRDAEAWLALGNVLVEHSDGSLTDPALYAWRKAADIDPAGLGPGYFLGLAMLRQGRFDEGYEAWRATLASTPPGAFGRALVEARYARLGELLKQAGMMQQQGQQVRPAAPATEQASGPASAR